MIQTTFLKYSPSHFINNIIEISICNAHYFLSNIRNFTYNVVTWTKKIVLRAMGWCPPPPEPPFCKNVGIPWSQYNIISPGENSSGNSSRCKKPYYLHFQLGSRRVSTRVKGGHCLNTIQLLYE